MFNVGNATNPSPVHTSHGIAPIDESTLTTLRAIQADRNSPQGRVRSDSTDSIKLTPSDTQRTNDVELCLRSIPSRMAENEDAATKTSCTSRPIVKHLGCAVVTLTGLGAAYMALKDESGFLAPPGRLPENPNPNDLQINFDARLSPLTFIDCTADQEASLTTAHRRVTELLDRTLNDNSVALRDKTRENLELCFSSPDSSCVDYACADQQNYCEAPGVFGGYFGSPGSSSSVLFCMDNFKSGTLLFEPCELAGLVMHEVAHYVGVWDEPDHNSGPNGDGVYTLDNTVASYCKLPF